LEDNVKKFASFVIAAASMMAAASGASAGSWTTGTYELKGPLVLNQSITLNCNPTKFGLNASSTSSGSVTSVDWSSSCNGTLTPGAVSWVATPISATSASIKLYVTTSLGYCDGTVTGVWNNSAQTLTFPSGTTVPGRVFGISVPCSITGTLTATPVAPTTGPITLS